MYQDKFIDFLELIDNEFIRKKISWMENDFIMGFEGFYGYILFFKEKIGKTYISEEILSILSHNYDKMHKKIICNENRKYNPIIDRDNYFNLYDPVFLSHSEKYNGNYIFHYDVRIDELYKYLQSKNISIFEEMQEFLLDYSDVVINRMIKSNFVGHFLSDKNIIIYNNIIEKIKNTDAQKTNGWHNSLLYSAELQIDLCSLFVDDFDYQEELSGKKFKVFTKKIDYDYQWALMLNSDITWGTCFFIIVIIKNSQTKPISPKDVVYQEHLLFLYGNMQTLPKTRESLNLQCYRYIFLNRHINRYIDYMQDKIMAVIYDK